MLAVVGLSPLGNAARRKLSTAVCCSANYFVVFCVPGICKQWTYTTQYGGLLYIGYGNREPGRHLCNGCALLDATKRIHGIIIKVAYILSTVQFTSALRCLDALL